MKEAPSKINMYISIYLFLFTWRDRGGARGAVVLRRVAHAEVEAEAAGTQVIHDDPLDRHVSDVVKLFHKTRKKIATL